MPASKTEVITRWKCQHCGYTWIPRVAKPVACPECRRRDP